MRIIKSHDDLPVKEYYEWLLRYNRLKDCSWFWNDLHSDRGRFTNPETVALRNTTSGKVEIQGDGNEVEIVNRNKYTLTQTRLAAHRSERKKRQAVWMTNDSSKDVLLLLVDLDRKQANTDCEAAAAHISQKYLGGHSYIERSSSGFEPSPLGYGLHVYFFVDLQYVPRAAFKTAMDRLIRVMRDDPVLASFHQPLDRVPIYGLPSYWNKKGDYYSLQYRGNQLKVPFLPNGRSDLALLDSLSPISGQKIVEWAKAREAESLSSPPLPPSSNIRVVQLEKPHSKPSIEGSGNDAGPKRRAELYVRMKAANANLTEDQYVAAYQIMTPENGGEGKVRADYQRMEQRFVVRQKKRQTIDMTKYVEAVKDAVPPLALVRKRRTSMTVERVAEFVAVKMFQAEQPGEHQAAQDRNATIKFWASLKAQRLVDWSLAEDSHAFLIKLCRRYKLLEVIEDYTCPSAPGAGNGRCRRIGPGEALGEVYERYQFTRQRLQADAVRKTLRRIG